MALNELTRGRQRALLTLLVLLSLTAGGQWLYRSTRSPLTLITAPDDRTAPKHAKPTTRGAVRRVEINTADSAAFEQLPRIGPATARRIIRYRQKIGGFRSLAQFRKVWGIDTLYPHIAQYVYLDSVPRAPIQEFPASSSHTTPTAPPKVLAGKRSYMPVDVNEADSASLEALPMIGPILARRIVQYRAKLGFYHSPEQIKEVYGMQDSSYLVFAPYLYVTTEALAAYPQVYINEATESLLARHPYIGYSLARRLVRYREQHGPYHSRSDLEKLQGTSAATWQRLAPYLNFR